MRGAYFFIVLAGIAALSAPVARVAADVNAASSTGNIRPTIPAGVDVNRVPVTERGWEVGRTDDIEIVGLKAPAVVPAVATTSDPLLVQTVSDMRTFGRDVAERNANIRLIMVSPETTEVDYAVQGKFLWIVPMKVNVDVSVDKEDDVKVELPWYGAFVKMAARFDVWDIEQTLDERAVSAPEDEFSRQAWTLQELAAIMKEYTARN